MTRLGHLHTLRAYAKLTLNLKNNGKKFSIFLLFSIKLEQIENLHVSRKFFSIFLIERHE